jgi:hypothetical protein
MINPSLYAGRKSWAAVPAVCLKGKRAREIS